MGYSKQTITSSSSYVLCPYCGIWYQKELGHDCSSVTSFATGWICPKCGNVYGPHVSECKVCNKPVVTVNIDFIPPTTGE